ncbi:MAG: bacteriochlorophyll/chlorophyll a synthase, partial [Limibacillus sp.]
MVNTVGTAGRSTRASPGVVLELLKPITWFAPMWAYACGVISSGQSLSIHWMGAIGG